MNILFDTDIGDDIDDAFALAVLIKDKRFNPAGVTTVYRDTVKRASLAACINNAAGRRDIPIYAGCGKPYLQLADISATPVQYGEECADFAPANDGEGIEGGGAVDFIISQAKKLGNGLTIIAGGALTNIAKAIERDYAAMSGVGKIIVTGGCFFHHHKEWNICCDVEAAKRVLESDLGNIICINWDVTRDIVLSNEYLDFIKALKPKRVGGYLAEYVRRWHADWKCLPILHSTAAMIYCIAPELFELRDISIKVETVGHCRGLTLNCDWLDFRDEAKKNAVRRTVAVSANAAPITAMFMKKVFNYNKKM